MKSPRPIPAAIASRLILPSAYAERSQLYEDFKWLRSNQPIGFVEVEGYDPFLLVTRHEDVLAMSRDNDLFINSTRPAVLTSRAGEAATRARSGHPWFVRLLIHRDGTDHLAHRRVIHDWFSPKRMIRLESEIRMLARDLLKDLRGRGGRCDVVTDVGMPFAARVLMLVIGMPAEDEDFLLDVTQRLFTRRGQTSVTEAERTVAGRTAGLQEVESATQDFMTYFAKLTAKRRSEPADDLASAIAKAYIDGSPITPIDAAALYLIILSAGHETAAVTMAGALWALFEHPRELEKVRASPDLVPAMVEEAVRWTTPVEHFMRTACRDAHLGGYGVPKDAWIMMSYLSANRDDHHFEEAESFVIGRPRLSKVAFGNGSHGCLGQHLARLELRVFFEELLPSLTRVEMSGTPQFAASMFLGGPSSLPVTLHLEQVS